VARNIQKLIDVGILAVRWCLCNDYVQNCAVCIPFVYSLEGAAGWTKLTRCSLPNSVLMSHCVASKMRRSSAVRPTWGCRKRYTWK